MAAWLPALCSIVVIAAACAGCVAPESLPRALARSPNISRAPISNQTAQLLNPSRSPPAGAAPTTPTPYTPPPVAADPRSQDLNRLMGELQSLGALDPAAQSQLLQDLQQTDPTLWPQMVQMFRASLAYRQRATTTPTPTASPNAPTIQTVAATAPIATPAAATSPAPPTSPTPAPQSTTNTPKPETTAAPPARYATPPATEPAKSSEVQLTSATAKAEKPTDWKVSLEATIAAMEKVPEAHSKPAEETARQAHLRMLYLAAGRRDDALKPISGASATEQDFWTQELYGLSTWLDTKGTTDPSRRAAEAAAHLNRAMTRLREASPLMVRNLAFCTEVSSYGVYQPFDKHEFKPGQQVILYAEVENFKSDETAKGFHTALRSSYQVLDAQGRRVAEHDLKLTEEHCHNPRRDYFVRYFITLPERLYDGKHTLQLTIEDTLGQKIGQSSIDFLAHEKPPSPSARKP